MKNTTNWDTPDGHSPVVAFFNAVSPISQGAMDAFDTHTYTLFVEKKKYIFKLH